MLQRKYKEVFVTKLIYVSNGDTPPHIGGNMETWRIGALGAAVTGECWSIKIFIPRVSCKHTALAYRDRDSRGILTVF